jgi:hypothetical protein
LAGLKQEAEKKRCDRMHPVKEKHDELDSEIEHEQDCWEYFVMNSPK